MSIKHSVGAFVTGLSLVLFSPFVAADDSEKLETAVPARLASQKLLLDIARAGDDTLVAVGERGHILISQDEGKTWAQSKVPTRVLLTAVYFSDEKRGWAVGHDAIILRTEDGGKNWERTHYSPDEERPLLDVWFDQGARVGYAIGAYGYLLRSNDGGRTWNSVTLGNEEEPDDFHLNSIVRSNSGVLYVASEAGTAYRSLDDGETWERLYPPYQGSFFGALSLYGESVLMFGLQGNVFRSDDGGSTWSPINIEQTAILNSGAVLNDGTVLVVGNEGALLVSKTGGDSFIENNLPDRKAIANAIATKDGGVLLVGEMGVRKLSLADLN